MTKFLNDWGLGFLVTMFYWLSKAIAAVGLIDKPISKDEFKESLPFKKKSQEDIECEIDSLYNIGPTEEIETDYQSIEDYSLLDLEDEEEVYDFVCSLLVDFFEDPIDKKVVAIKHVRNKTGLGLKETKYLVDVFERVHRQRANKGISTIGDLIKDQLAG